MSNFSFLRERWPDLSQNGQLAEKYLYSDPNASLFKVRLFSEQLIDLYFVALKLDNNIDDSQFDKVQKLSQDKKLNPAIANLFHLVRKLGNKAAHEGHGDLADAKESLLSVYKLAVWFYIKVTGDKTVVTHKFKWPPKEQPKLAKVIDFEAYQKEIEELKQAHQAEIQSLQQALAASPPNEAQVAEGLQVVTNELGLTEAETRKKLIDALLKEAEWDVQDSEQVKLEYEVYPFPNPTGKGIADYVLFDRVGKPIAVVEAKKASVNPVVGRNQAKLYADALEQMHGVRPVIYYTNGHEIWMWDDKYSEPRQVWGFYTLDDLEWLMLQHEKKQSLKTVQVDPNIAGRSYQIEGIKRVYEKFEDGRRRALLVMATGSGKTRTVIAMTKGMMQANWAKRILFLADRDELVEQAMNKKSSFKTFMPEDPRVRITTATVNDREKSIYFSTYQAMKKHYDTFSVGFFDVIIADESHRSIYKSYREILEYFDANIVGLTATPVSFINRNTFDLFDCPDGDPTFHYSYEEAYTHIPPYLLLYKAKDASTEFLRKGIKWDNLTEEQKRQLEEEGLSEEQINFDREALEQFVTNKPTNQFILRTLMNEGVKVGDTIGKTIIFARNIRHAEFLLELFDELYPQYKGELATIIHSDMKNNKQMLDNFKFEDRPRIAISVDMLDTGIDVPEVVNLSFAKPVYSKVKFLQMIGRGTRLCEDLFGKGKHKEYFAIFDHWQNFQFFDINPDGLLPSDTKSSIQVRFELRVKLLEVFAQKHMTQQQQEMIALIRDDISNLPEKSIEVKKMWKTLEMLKLDQSWNLVNKNLLNVLMLEIAPLIQWIDTEGQQDAIWFDNEMYRMQLYKLTGDKKLAKHIENVIYQLTRLRLNLNQFNGVREYIIGLMKVEPWNGATHEEVEHSRVTLRDLMKYRGETVHKPFLQLNITDTGHQVTTIKETPSAYSSNMDAYAVRVRETLEKEMNLRLVIRKIRKGEKLTEYDRKSVYELFNSGKFEFSLEDLSKGVHIKPDDLEGILRKFIGVDVEELNKRFEQFVHTHHAISPTQIKILEMIKNDIIKNQGISFESLYEEPYTSFSSDGVDGIFDESTVDDVFSLIEPYKITAEERYA